MHARSLAVPLLLLLLGPDRPSVRVRINNNRRAAGTLRGGLLTIRLEARLGTWQPDGDDAPGAQVPAFAEAGKAPQIPGPLIRVPAGTDVALTIHNAVPDSVLTVHGLHARPRTTLTSDTLQVAPGATRGLHFRLDEPGTYYYWGTTMGRTFRARTREDAQLSGAIIVDEPGRRPPPDRVLVIGVWEDTAGGVQLPRERERELFVVNGRSWPHTERLSYTVGDTVRWRVLNISADLHPMHLHGFYYRVDSRGDGTGDTSYTEAGRDFVVTQRMTPGQTMRLTWIPERPGNWLFHCHIPRHFGPRGPLGLRRPAPPGAERTHATSNHALEGMNGLMVGVTVTEGKHALRDLVVDEAQRRHLRLLVRENAGGSAAAPYYGFALQEGGPEPAADSGHRAGPAIVLTRGQPVSIMVMNRLPEATAVHWHGIELESYFDGVAGFSGSAARLSPLIAPGDSFEARFTPPRAGTFIYHTHVDELRQQPAGLAGPLIVLEPDVPYDPATDMTVLISSPSDSIAETRAVLLNGSLAPAPLDMRVGVAHRVRFINITKARPGLRVELVGAAGVVAWRVIAKDGADLPASRRVTGPARLPISIGETVDVEVTPAEPGELRLEGRAAEGFLLGVMPVRIHR